MCPDVSNKTELQEKWSSSYSTNKPSQRCPCNTFVEREEQVHIWLSLRVSACNQDPWPLIPEISISERRSVIWPDAAYTAFKRNSPMSVSYIFDCLSHLTMEIYLANSLLIKRQTNIHLPLDVLVLCHTQTTGNIQWNSTVSGFFFSREVMKFILS